MNGIQVACDCKDVDERDPWEDVVREWLDVHGDDAAVRDVMAGAIIAEPATR